MSKSVPISACEVHGENDTPIRCRDCSVYRLGLAPGHLAADPQLLTRIARNRRELRRGEYLFRLDEPLRAIYAVRFGTLKSYVFSDDGRMQITGFHIAGEALGLSDLARGRHSTEAQALESTSLCEIPLADLETISREIPSVTRQLQYILSDEIHHYQRLALLLGRKTAEERLASFLLDLSSRYLSRGFSPLVFHLSMSRGDIGTHLGIAEETVCRLFTRFQEDGLIEVRRRQVRLLFPDRLRLLARG